MSPNRHRIANRRHYGARVFPTPPRVCVAGSDHICNLRELFMQQRQLRQIGTHLMTACAVVGGFALAACGDNNGHSNDGSGANGTSFAPIDAASTDAAKRAVIGTDFATIAGKTRETGYVTILHRKSTREIGRASGRERVGQYV